MVRRFSGTGFSKVRLEVCSRKLFENAVPVNRRTRNFKLKLILVSCFGQVSLLERGEGRFGEGGRVVQRYSGSVF